MSLSQYTHPSLSKDVTVAEAPSNIALIKYMGKVAPAGDDRNRPTNPSLSVTLPHLRTRVELEQISETADAWAPLQADGWLAPDLSEKGQARFLAHFARLKVALKISGFYQIRSANNFPSDCGLASSASSFAALTMAAAKLAQKRGVDVELSLARVADLSRQGSGSSIRSFYDNFCVWDATGAYALDIPLKLAHAVIVVEDSKKTVSSSEAHTRVTTSPLFANRPERATRRMEELIQVLRAVGTEPEAWREAFRIVWDEFHDMHALFSTSAPPFSYMTEATTIVLNELETLWRRRGDGPLVTMDAGANVHLLYRADQEPLRRQTQEFFSAKGFLVL